MELFSNDLNVHNLLFYATIGGIVWFLLDRFLLHPVIFRFFGRLLIWHWNPRTENDLDHMNVKIPKFIGKIVYHGTMQLCWYFLFAVRFTDWMDKWDWHNYTKLQKNEGPEYEAIVPLYLMYFSFTIFSFLKDLGKMKNLDFAQAMFQLHHVLAISLTYGSLYVGHWRAGFLTTFTHQPADLILYSCKIYHSKFEMGFGNIYGLYLIVVVLNFGWFYSRVYLYGLLVRGLWSMFEMQAPSVNPLDWTFTDVMSFALLLGSTVMLILQVIWQFGIFQFAITKAITGGKIEDPWHNQKHQKKKD